MRKHKQKWNGKRVDYEHRIIWEKVHGKIPKGYVIHHINEIQSDNRIENLKLMTNSNHAIFHNKNKSKKTKEKMSDSMKKLAKEDKLKTIFKKGHAPWNKGKKGYSLKDKHRVNVIKAIRKRYEETRLPHKNGFYTCNKCKKLKSKFKFYKRKLSWNGLAPICINCIKENRC